MNKQTQKTLFSSRRQDWETPRRFFAIVSAAVGGFGFDAAARSDNSLAPAGFFFDRGDDALAGEAGTWATAADGSNIWLNPPYGRNISKFVARAAAEREAGANIALLIPARTDTKYFHDHLYRRDGIEILYLRGRLKFGESKTGAPFPSMLCFLRGTPDGLSLSHNGRFFIINHGLDAAGVFAGFNS